MAKPKELPIVKGVFRHGWLAVGCPYCSERQLTYAYSPGSLIPASCRSSLGQTHRGMKQFLVYYGKPKFSKLGRILYEV